MSQPIEPLNDWLSSSVGLSDSELELFVIRLPSVSSPLKNAGTDDDSGLLHLLDDWEAQQFEQFKFDLDRDRYLMSHVSLRVVLSHLLNCTLDDLNYAPRNSPFVRPELAKSHGAKLRFSLSHSEDLVAMAVAASGPVGVDVEPYSRADEAAGITGEYLAESEIAVVDGLPSAERSRACLALWTAKEAVLKALDVGLAHPPEKVAFDMRNGVPVRLDRILDFPDQKPIEITVMPLDTISAFVSVAAAPRVNIGHLWFGEFNEIRNVIREER